MSTGTVPQHAQKTTLVTERQIIVQATKPESGESAARSIRPKEKHTVKAGSSRLARSPILFLLDPSHPTGRRRAERALDRSHCCDASPESNESRRTTPIAECTHVCKNTEQQSADGALDRSWERSAHRAQTEARARAARRHTAPPPARSGCDGGRAAAPARAGARTRASSRGAHFHAPRPHCGVGIRPRGFAAGCAGECASAEDGQRVRRP